MGRTGKVKRVYINIPYRLYAAMLQDIESRPRSTSVEHAVQECIRAKYANAKVRREYLVRAGNEVSSGPESPGEAASTPAGRAFSPKYGSTGGYGLARPATPARERKLQRKRDRENFRSQLDMMTGGSH